MLATILVGTVSALEASRPQPQGTLRDARKATGWVCEAGGYEAPLWSPKWPGAALVVRRRLNAPQLPVSESRESGISDRAFADHENCASGRHLSETRTNPCLSRPGYGTAPDWRGVSANYFETRHIPLRRGREFTPADEKNQSTMIINEVMARKFWPEADPIGKTLLNRDYRSPLEIIGIVGDVRGAGLNAQAKPEMYTPLRGFWYAFLVLRTKRGPSEMASAVRKEIAALDSGVPTYQVATMDQLLSASVANERFNLFLLVLFAALALGLAAVGIYGVLAFGVSRRSREIGIRLALGARPRDVLRLVVRQGMQLVIAGVLLGIAGALALTRLMASLLYGVSPTDPATFVVVSALLPMVALIACYFPARRAMHVDPMVALRVE